MPTIFTPPAQLLEPGSSSCHETRLLHHGGQALDVELSVSRLPADGEDTGCGC